MFYVLQFLIVQTILPLYNVIYSVYTQLYISIAIFIYIYNVTGQGP